MSSRDAAFPMKLLRHFHIVLLIFAAGCAGFNPGNEILPGITLYEQEKPLSGRLVFLRSALLGTGGRTTEPPTVYSYDLSTKQLLKVVEMEASARLSVALDGSLICADSSMALSIPKRGFFLYQPSAKEGVVVELPWEPKVLVPLCKRVFAVGGFYGHMQIAQYDVMRKSVSLLSLPGASQWESQSYHSARWQFKSPCTLFFEIRTARQQTTRWKGLRRRCLRL